MGKKELVSVLTFDPKGPRDLPINSPRSLLACEQMEVHPTDLFILSKKDFEAKLAEEEIETEDIDSAYKSYTKEMKDILESIAALRQEIIENGASAEKGKKTRKDKDKDAKARSHKDKRAASAADHGRDQDADQSDSHHDSDHKQAHKPAARGGQPEAEQEEEQAIKSKNLGKKRRTKKKRPATASAQPTEEMLRNFQTTQVLGRGSDERTGKSEKNQSEVSQRPQSIRKIEDMQRKEMRRQENLITSSQVLETKKQRLLNKILFDNIKVKKLKLEKEDFKNKLNYSKSLKDQQRYRLLEHHQMQVLDRLREVEAKRAMREQHALQHQKLMLFYKQQKALESQARWEEKRTHVNNLKDIEEFKRGMMMADICMEDKQFEMWKYAKEQERKDQKEIARALAKRKEQIAQQLERERLLKEDQNRRLADQLRNDDNCLAQLVEVMAPAETRPRRRTRQPKKDADAGASKPSREAQRQIREFKRSNKAQIKQLLEQQEQAVQQLAELAGKENAPDQQALEQRVEEIKAQTEQMIGSILADEKKALKKFLRECNKQTQKA